MAQDITKLLAQLNPPELISALKALDKTLQKNIVGLEGIQASISLSDLSTHITDSENPKGSGSVKTTNVKPVKDEIGKNDELRKTADGSIPPCTWALRDTSKDQTSLKNDEQISPPDKEKESETGIRLDQVTIYVRVVFLKLGEIDTVAEKFNADAFIQARWSEPNLDGQHFNTQFELCAHDVFWDPKLFVENTMGEPKESVWQIVSFNDIGEATIYQRRRVKGTYFERMELMQYPFDTQDLTLTLSTDRGEHEVDLQADESEVSSVNIQSFVDEQEWHLHKHINTMTRVTTNAYQNSKHKHPAVSISCNATRRSQFFVWNIIVILIGICSLVFATFSVNLEKPENRIQLTFILLLSNITFKFTVNQTLPKVSYLTYLDKYILSSMAILCMVCVWHAIVPLLSYDMALARNADIYAFIILAGLYVGFNIFFFTWSKCLVSRRSREYSKKDARQKERLKIMEKKGASANEVAPI